MTIQELTSKEEEIQREIKDVAEKHNLFRDNYEPIFDGIYSSEKYLSASLRIMWILKEPYDEIDEDGVTGGGGWSIPKHLFKEPEYDYYSKGKLTAKIVTRLSYCILNDKKFSESKCINGVPNIADSLQNIAYVNINKMPARTSTNDASLYEKYQIWKPVLLKQIESYSPDIIIFGGTFYDYFALDLFDGNYPELNYKFGMAKGFLRNDSLLISACHPGYRYFQSEEMQDNYASEILKVINTWKSQRKDIKNDCFSKEKSMDFRVDCIADCLKEMKKQLLDEFGVNAIERDGNGGDDTYWGRWKDKETSPEIIADWLLDRLRQGAIGYKVKVNNDFDAKLYLCGDARTFYVYIHPVSEEAKKLISLKYEEIKNKYVPEGWLIPKKDKLNETDWILRGPFGGLSYSIDFRNAGMDEDEYKDRYQKFKSIAIQEMISGRDDSILRTVEELGNLIGRNSK